jgi:YD repeat-containing protein
LHAATVYSYDSLQRLTGVTYDNGGSIAYTYDAVGNRLTLVSQASTPAATITVGANTNVGGTVTGTGIYFVGSNDVLTATASNGWRFILWSDGSTNNPRTVVVSSNMIYTATFAPTAVLTVQANPAAGGSVTGGGQYIVSSNATVTATASNNWLFMNWNGSITNNPWLFPVASGTTVCTANFAHATLVTLTPNPAFGGSASGGGTYLSGSNVTLTANAAPGWLFAQWNDGNTNASRSLTVPAANVAYTATFVRGIGAAVDATNLTWTTGGNANWAVQTATTRDGVAALQSGAIGAGQQTWFQTTTNGPGSLQFWWKVSSAANNNLQFYINTQLVSQISGNVDWNQVVTFIGTSNQVTLKWVYTNTTGATSGSNAGWVDQVSWTPCPYAERVPQMFYQDPSGMLASWVLNSTGGVRFARVLANTGAWVLKAAGDVDGDGVSDLLFENAGGDTGGWFMNADGSVRSALYWFNIGAWEIKACADYEGIGRGQLFFQTPAGMAAYWRLDTNGNFLASVTLGNMAGWKLRGAGDLDGDGKAELFWQNAAGLLAIWYHNPDGSIRGATSYNTGVWALCGVADIDGDGVSDLLWQTPGGDTGGWFMNSNSTARAANFWWNTGAWKLRAAGR